MHFYPALWQTKDFLMRKHVALSCAVVLAAMAGEALAVQYPVIDPGYSQQIYTGPLVGGPGLAWTNSGNMLSRNGSDIIEYSPTQNTTYLGTNLHGSIATHSITGLFYNGVGMVKGLDGYMYAPGQAGLQRFNLSTWGPAQTLAGTAAGPGYGATLLQDGRIVYNAGSGSNDIHIYNPGTGLDSTIYSASGLIDDIEAGPGGLIALAGQANQQIIVINSSGTVLSQFTTTHYADGLAFGDGSASNALFSNNNDGTITRYSWSSGISGAPSSMLDIAGVSGAYGDLASVGPDCAFYVSQFNNAWTAHGNVFGIGTNWDLPTTTADGSIIRIASTAGGADGLPECGFYNVYEHVPEPATFATIGMASVGLLFRRRTAVIGAARPAHRRRV